MVPRRIAVPLIGLTGLVVACTPPVMPPAIAAPSGLATLAPRWDAPFDTQSGLAIVSDRIVESGWRGIGFRAIADGAETARADDAPPFRAWIDEPGEPVLFPFDGFVIASGRDHVLGRFEPDATAFAWTSSACRRAWAAAPLGAHVAVLCTNGLVVLDAASGGTIRTLEVPASEVGDEHALVAASGGLVLREADVLVGVSDEGSERFRIEAPGTFGLAGLGASFFVVSLAEGLVERSASTGERVRSVAIPGLEAGPDAMTMRLGRVVVDDDLALVEAGGRIAALSLADGSVLWSIAGSSATIGPDAVFACRGVRALALERTTGVERWSWSVGGCEVLGVTAHGVLVRHDSAGGSVTQAELVYQGVTDFEPSTREVPCETVTLRGTVRVNGAVAAGVHVRAGVAWSTTSGGAVAGWGSRTLPDPRSGTASATSETDAGGTFELRLCDRGHVPVVVDHADLERLSGQPEVDGTFTYVHLDGGGSYALDFEVSAHGPTP